MNKKISGVLLILVLFLNAYSKGNEDNVVKSQDADKKAVERVLSHSRTTKPFFLSKRARLSKELYQAVHHASVGYEPEWVETVLKKGANPDVCIGECGWWDSNPLMVLMEAVNGTYYHVRDAVQDADVQAFRSLIKHGADIKLLPYVWYRVYLFNNEDIRSLRNRDKKNNIAEEEILRHINNILSDNNRLLKAFLEAGADPDMKGHPYPFSSEAMYTMTDEIAATYFANGTRAINVAIEKGMVWESQVDLLLQYSKLDDESLEAAKRSGDQQMIDKIHALWEKQDHQK